MTMAAAWADRNASDYSAWKRSARRLMVSLRLVRRRMAHRRLVNQILAQSDDPAVLVELGIRQRPSAHTERWIAAMVRHQS